MSTPAPVTAGFRANVLEEELGALRRNAFKSPANDAVALSTEQLLADGAKLKNKVVLITGSGSLDGFGGRLALKAAGYGAKVVVSDLKAEGVEKVVQKIKEARGYVVISSFSPLFCLPFPSLLRHAALTCHPNRTATGIACDVTDWNQQLALFVRFSFPCLSCSSIDSNQLQLAESRHQYFRKH